MKFLLLLLPLLLPPSFSISSSFLQLKEPSLLSLPSSSSSLLSSSSSLSSPSSSILPPDFANDITVDMDLSFLKDAEPDKITDMSFLEKNEPEEEEISVDLSFLQEKDENEEVKNDIVDLSFLQKDDSDDEASLDHIDLSFLEQPDDSSDLDHSSDKIDLSFLEREDPEETDRHQDSIDLSFLQQNEDEDSLDVFSFDPNTSDSDISNDVDMSFLEKNDELDVVGSKKEVVPGSFLQMKEQTSLENGSNLKMNEPASKNPSFLQVKEGLSLYFASEGQSQMKSTEDLINEQIRLKYNTNENESVTVMKGNTLGLGMDFD